MERAKGERRVGVIVRQVDGSWRSSTFHMPAAEMNTGGQAQGLDGRASPRYPDREEVQLLRV